MDVSSFLAGAGLASVAWTTLYWLTIAAMRREDAKFRREQRKRIDDLAERSERMYEQARREIGLPTRLKS